MKCFLCGGEVIWQSDEAVANITGDPEDERIVSYYSCSECGAFYEIYQNCDNNEQCGIN